MIPKGQLISEFFPKKSTKKWQIAALESKKLLNQQKKAHYNLYGLFNVLKTL